MGFVGVVPSYALVMCEICGGYCTRAYRVSVSWSKPHIKLFNSSCVRKVVLNPSHRIRPFRWQKQSRLTGHPCSQQVHPGIAKPLFSIMSSMYTSAPSAAPGPHEHAIRRVPIRLPVWLVPNRFDSSPGAQPCGSPPGEGRLLKARAARSSMLDHLPPRYAVPRQGRYLLARRS